MTSEDFKNSPKKNSQQLLPQGNKIDKSSLAIVDDQRGNADNLMKEHDKEYFELFEGCKDFHWSEEFKDVFLCGIDLRDGLCSECRAKIYEAKRQKKRQIEFLEKINNFRKPVTESDELFNFKTNLRKEIEQKIKILKMEVERE